MTLQDKYDLVFLNEIRGLNIDDHMSLTPYTETSMKKLLDVTKPERMLEIGFNAGHSAFMWQTLSTTLKNFHSLDICHHRHTQPCATILKFLFPPSGKKCSFKFGAIDTSAVRQAAGSFEKYDTVFIDGDTSHKGFHNDLRMCTLGSVHNIIVGNWDSSQEIRNTVQGMVSDTRNDYELIEFFGYDKYTKTGVLRSKMALVKRVVG